MSNEDDFEPDFSKISVAIWGLGLMGGSLALALSGKCAELIGIDPDPAVVERAAASGVFSRVAGSPRDIIARVDLIVLAAPVRGILEQLAALPCLHPGRCVVLDLGSTKRQILEAMAALPEQFDPVGGHPMCGSEQSSFQFAAAALFEGAPFALIPLPRSTTAGRTLAEVCVRTCGGQPLWMDAPTHDRWTAMTSHLPYLIASALSASVSPDASPLAGPGLRSTTRLAASSPAMMLDVLMSNRDFLLDALHIFRQSLDELEADLRQGNETQLKEKLQRACNARATLLAGGAS
jgi:prephenate dehydrogenase